ncbi:tetratricopeptide repeat protein, partial [Microseira wollei]|uniref:tetratricopeptide repeat protein n=1 Tax=Microseira wollei TaxID=467598 RepID=UPI001CFEF6A2
MKPDLTDWDEDIPTDPESEYRALVRALKRTKGFGLLFVECSPAVGEELIGKVKQDVSQKKVEVLRLEKPIDNLYELVANLPQRDEINVLFVSGIEESLYEYEAVKREIGWKDEEIRGYSWKGVPHILIHLNQQRERFRDNFNICFVFLLRRFAINYFIHRAPDFFDWRSGLFKFPSEQELVAQASERLILEGDYEKYLDLTPKERYEKILEIQELLTEEHQTPDYKAKLLFERGTLLYVAKEYEASIASLDQALKIKPDLHQAWYNRGIALKNLGRLEEAIAAYDQALKIKPDLHQAWFFRGIALGNLGRLEEAIAAYDQALKIKPDLHEAWYNRGIALKNLGRFEEAIASYDQALKIKPDKDEAWNNRGNALDDLGRLEEAIASFDQALKFKPDDNDAWNNRGIALKNLGRLEEAIASFDQALKFKPDDNDAWNNRGIALKNLGRLEEA